MSRDLREIQYVCILNTKLHKMASEDLFSRCQRWSPRGRPWPRGRPRLEGQVLGLGFGLEASSPRKLACPRLEDSSIFWTVKIFVERLKNFLENVFLWRSLEKFLWRPFFFIWRAQALVSLVLGLGLEHSCPWPRECLSSERLSLALASDFFCVLGLGLGLEPCVFDSTSARC